MLKSLKTKLNTVNDDNKYIRVNVKEFDALMRMRKTHLYAKLDNPIHRKGEDSYYPMNVHIELTRQNALKLVDEFKRFTEIKEMPDMEKEVYVVRHNHFNTDRFAYWYISV